MTNEKIEIPSSMRVDQMKAIELYIKAAKDDHTLTVFLKTLRDKIDSGLKKNSEEDK